MASYFCPFYKKQRNKSKGFSALRKIVWKENFCKASKILLELPRGLSNNSNYLCSCIIDYFLCGQITFVADKQLVDGFAGISIDLLKPLFDVVERLLICHIINHNDSVCASVVTEFKTDN